MTDIRDINSTSHTTKDLEGNTVQTVRDSLLAEILLSLIMGITILSCMMVLKSYINIITVSMYMQFVPLTVTVLHTIIRRLRINSLFFIFLMHIAVSAGFFFAVINIPSLQYGNSMANRFYLAGILIGLTLFSLFYRLKPSFTAADHELIVFPAILHVIFYLLYAIAGRKEFSQNLIINAIIMAILFIFMRQIAVFDTKYYHSIHKLSRPSSLLKKQNYRTVLGLAVVITVALVVLAVFPIDTVSNIIVMGIRAFFGLLISLIKLPESDYEIDLNDPMEEVNSLGPLGPEGEYNPWIDFIGTALAVIILIGVICLIINALLVLIRNAPKLSKKNEAEDDGNLVDTIEDLKPEKKHIITGSPDFGTGYERRIRKQFYNKTRRAMKKGLPVSAASTPGQIRTVLQADGDNDIAPLIQEYEKVRYGK